MDQGRVQTLIMKTPIEKRIKHLIKSVNRLRMVGKYNLSKETGKSLILILPKEFKKPSQTVAHGVIDIENYLRQELAELEYLITDEHEAKEYVL